LQTRILRGSLIYTRFILLLPWKLAKSFYFVAMEISEKYLLCSQVGDGKSRFARVLFYDM